MRLRSVATFWRIVLCAISLMRVSLTLALSVYASPTVWPTEIVMSGILAWIAVSAASRSSALRSCTTMPGPPRPTDW